MPDITITLTDAQYKGLEYIALTPETWAKTVLTERARIANDEIVKIYTDRALDEGIQIPTTREEIITDAFSRGWVQTASEVQAALEAEHS